MLPIKPNNTKFQDLSKTNCKSVARIRRKYHYRHTNKNDHTICCCSDFSSNTMNISLQITGN